MAAEKKEFQITRSLQETVRKNKNIKEVHFNENGDHFFKKHEIEIHQINDENESKGVKKVWSLPGVVRQPVKVKVKENRKDVLKDKMVNVKYEPIAASFTREEILTATAVGDKKTEAQKIEILRQAAEIAKGDDIQGLLNKINSEPAKAVKAAKQ
jgi:hypothetical protein